MEKAYLIDRPGRGKTGASLVEYAILILLVALAVVAAVTSLGQNLQQPFSEVASAIN